MIVRLQGKHDVSSDLVIALPGNCSARALLEAYRVLSPQALCPDPFLPGFWRLL
jgi:hypothetical protein